MIAELAASHQLQSGREHSAYLKWLLALNQFTEAGSCLLAITLCLSGMQLAYNSAAVLTDVKRMMVVL